MKISVKNFDNKVVKEIDLPEEIFGYPYKEHLVHVVIEAYRAAQRSGSASTKGRGEVRGSTRKPWRQKGTGRARVGQIRSPLWRSGGITHGPKPRSYEKRISVGEKKSALKSVLAQKLRDEEIIVVENFDLDSHKTGSLAKKLAALGVDGKTLVVDRNDNENLGRAARNNPRLKTVDALGVNVYDVVGRRVLLSEQALEKLLEVLR